MRTPAHVWRALKVAQSSTIPMLCFDERKRCRVTCANTGACARARIRTVHKQYEYCTTSTHVQTYMYSYGNKRAQRFDRMGYECERRARDRKEHREAKRMRRYLVDCRQALERRPKGRSGQKPSGRRAGEGCSLAGARDSIVRPSACDETNEE